MKKKNWRTSIPAAFTWFVAIYSFVMVVDRLLYRFWGIGSNEDNMLTLWICLLPLWIYFLQENKTPAAAPEPTDPVPADEPTADEPTADEPTADEPTANE